MRVTCQGGAPSRLPWEDPATAYGNSIPTVPREILEKQARAAAKLAEEKVGKPTVSTSHRLMCY